MRFEAFSFGSIRIDSVTYEHDRRFRISMYLSSATLHLNKREKKW